MTEDEAKTRWCPFARTKTLKFSSEDGGVTAANRDFDGLSINQLHTCIASACMAWRRQTVMIDRTTGEAAVLGVSKLESLEQRWSEHGFCGLAGAPL